VVAVLRGRTVVGTGRKGKHLWLELDRRPWPAFHMGMSGWFETVPPGDEPPRFWKLALTAGGRRVAFCDIRRFGRVRLMQDPLSEPPISALGFDPLVGLPPAAELGRLLAKRSAPIKAVLLDQSLFAGVGNWIADEVLFQAGIRPHRLARELSKAEVAKIRRVLHAIIARAVKADADSSKFPKDLALPPPLGPPRRPGRSRTAARSCARRSVAARPPGSRSGRVRASRPRSASSAPVHSKSSTSRIAPASTAIG
jgi:formamidopyrimidine-DNA glycosylase